MSAPELVLSAASGQGFGAVTGATVPERQQDQIDRSLRCAQLRTNEQVDWIAQPQQWMDRFVNVYSSQAGWDNWQIIGLPLLAAQPGEKLLHRLARSLESGMGDEEIEAVRSAIKAVERLIEEGEPAAKPFQSAESSTEKNAISFGSVRQGPGGGLSMTCGFVYLNITRRVHDFVLGEQVATRASVQSAKLVARWNQQYFDMFEPKINEYLAARKKQIFTKFKLNR
ncbi:MULTISPECIES: hypothetical protein [Amycolatopsis]|uniref:Uncharacterized protein n=2 Tax=Amycolatopsis TaxID=1813 RepID=A0A1I3X4G5_9PSEU|nr:hypothetical protein [Amycolatopsis sacchari]SFK14558.1 hypothetical protein SAMN05421835_114155 [Amycolatopsis sacchari]